MSQRERTLERALAYPFTALPGSCVAVDGRAEPLPPQGLDLSGRTPLLAYGANAAPAALARKLAPLPGSRLPVLGAELGGHDVVYSAHLSPYGAVPAALRESPGTTVAIHVVYPDSEQLPLLSRSEPNYELTTLAGLECRRADGGELPLAAAYLSRHGFLSVDGAPVALAAVPARGRALAAWSEEQALEAVRAQLAPERTLAEFVAAAVTAGGLAPLPPLRSIP